MVADRKAIQTKVRVWRRIEQREQRKRMEVKNKQDRCSIGPARGQRNGLWQKEARKERAASQRRAQNDGTQDAASAGK